MSQEPSPDSQPTDAGRRAGSPAPAGGGWGRLLIVVGVLPFFALAAGWMTGQIVRDRWRYVEHLFHIPAPMVAVAGVLLAGLLAFGGRRSLAGLLLGLSLWPSVITLVYDNHWRSPASPCLARDTEPDSAPERRRLVHWNVAYGTFGWDLAAQTILGQRPSIVVLSEPPFTPGHPADPRLRQLASDLIQSGWKSASVYVDEKIALLAEDPIEQPRLFEIPYGDAVLLRLQTKPDPLVLLLIDLPSSIRRQRDPQLQRVLELVSEHRPDLVVGDFNAVRQATRLQHLPAGYRHAYDEAGAGWSYTWPVPVPMLAIDQCLLGPRTRACDYQLFSGASDHRLQRLDFEQIRDVAQEGVDAR